MGGMFDDWLIQSCHPYALTTARESMQLRVDDVAGLVVDAALKLHLRLGPGLLESVYETLLARDLEGRGLKIQRQLSIAFDFEGLHFDEGLRVDLLVNDILLVELKSIDKLSPVHAKQVLTYLRLLKLPVGLLINFGGATLKEGLRRVVNNYTPSAPSVLRINQPRAP